MIRAITFHLNSVSVYVCESIDFFLSFPINFKMETFKSYCLKKQVEAFTVSTRCNFNELSYRITSSEKTKYTMVNTVNRKRVILETFFYLLFGCPTANFESLSRGQLHSPDVNDDCVILVSTRRSPGAL